MSEPDLFGALAPPSIPPTAYFALRPDHEAAWDIENRTRLFQRRRGLAGRPCPADRLHISLCLVGSGKCDIEAAIRAAARIRADAFPVTFDMLSTFGGGTCLVLRNSLSIEALTGFRNQLQSVLVGGAVWPGRPSFTPHVTVLRPISRIPDLWLREPICWVARDFVLALEGRGRNWDIGRWMFD